MVENSVGDTALQAAELNRLAELITGKNIRLPGFFTGQQFVESAEVEDDVVFVALRSGNKTSRQYLNLAELQAAAGSVEQEAATPATGEDIFLIVEGERIRLAYSFDPYLAVSLSGVRPLPHQLEAVYERMLPQPRLRFLLADDPGAGKTIMTGLLLKELKLRGALDRVLIVTPAPLTLQWKDELFDKFDEDAFVIESRSIAVSNAWENYGTCIISIDLAKADEVRSRLKAMRWDMVVIDEAHKCSATRSGEDVKKTRRYTLAEELSAITDRLLLLTATPHQGNVDQFNLFLQLLDPDIFADQTRARQLLSGTSSWFLRRIKEEMRDLKGRRLFSPREVMTQPFELKSAELRLYNEVNRYINEFLQYPSDGRKKASVALARTVLQRRLASSLRAITSSLYRRRDRISEAATRLVNMSESERQTYLQKQGLLRVENFDDEQFADGDETEQQEEAALGVVAEARIERLRAEVEELNRLIVMAERTAEAGEEAKLSRLIELLRSKDFAEMRQLKEDGTPAHPGSLLIFTEHRDTLNYLTEKLAAEGYTYCVIHGGMDTQQRRDAQSDFRNNKQICVATEAAGEGINLQFCHLMINYDIPWNPNRLEQRMGRIHRIGQERTVYVFNFAASNTIEGKILNRLLEKLNQIRKDMGSDRVFDVVGMMLQLSDYRLEDVLREAMGNDDSKAKRYLEQIEQLSMERVQKLEQATGIALASSNVDLALVHNRELSSEEGRVMPLYVQDYFKKAVAYLNIRYNERVGDHTLSIERVPAYLGDAALRARSRAGRLSGRRVTYPKSSYAHLTFDKEIITSNKYGDAELLAPDHPLYVAILDVLDEKLNDRLGQAAFFHDIGTAEPYTLHFFRVDVIGENGRGDDEVIYSTVRAVRETAAGFDLYPPDRICDFQPASLTADKLPKIDEQVVQKAARWLMRGEQSQVIEEQRGERTRRMQIALTYFDEACRGAINLRKAKQARFQHKLVMAADLPAGEQSAEIGNAQLLVDRYSREIEALERRYQTRRREFNSLQIVRAGDIVHMATAYVLPAPNVDADEDPTVEQAAMDYVMAFERERGWEPVDVSKLGDSSGFDVRSLGPADSEGRRPVRRIEVKGRRDPRAGVMLTVNEWRKAVDDHNRAMLQGTEPTYWLYVVWGAGSGQERLLTIHDPGGKLETREVTGVKGYQVYASSIEAAAK